MTSRVDVQLALSPSAAADRPMIWVDGRAVSPDAPHLSALDRGFTLADGLFETMLVRDGVAFRLRQHLDRLERGAVALRIPLRRDLAAMIHDALAEARAGGRSEASLRLTLSRGSGPAGLAPPADCEAVVVLVLSPPPSYPASTYDDGISVRIASGRRNECAMTAGLKTLGYTDAVMALAEARAAGADDALFLDTEGHLSEGTASNVFVAHREALVTPPLSCGALPGITRAAVIELAGRLGVHVHERMLLPDEPAISDELFLTSSLRGIAPVVRVDGRPVGDGRPGPVTRRLREAYDALVRAECAR